VFTPNVAKDGESTQTSLICCDKFTVVERLNFVMSYIAHPCYLYIQSPPALWF